MTRKVKTVKKKPIKTAKATTKKKTNATKFTKAKKSSSKNNYSYNDYINYDFDDDLISVSDNSYRNSYRNTFESSSTNSIRDSLGKKDTKFNSSQLLVAILAALITLACSIVGFVIYNNSKEDINRYKVIWQESYGRAYNHEDYLGQIVFESGIINEPIVQNVDDTYYLHKNFETNEYNLCGPVFVDGNKDLENDNNLVLFGHNRAKSVDPDGRLAFTPLHLLEDEINYQDNKTLRIVYKDKVEKYLISYVYIINSFSDDTRASDMYSTTNFTQEEFDNYIEIVEENKIYDTNEKINYGDKMLTLQTYFEGSNNKLIVLAKLVDTDTIK